MAPKIDYRVKIVATALGTTALAAALMVFWKQRRITSREVSSVGTRRLFVAGNCKGSGTLDSAQQLIESLNSQQLKGQLPDRIEIVIAPTHLHLHKTKSQLKGTEVAAQNCWTKQGAFTGEISADQLIDLGVPWVIIGHSDRRYSAVFPENHELIGEKVRYCIEKGLKVILCIGEKQKHGLAHDVNSTVSKQLAAVLASGVSDWSKIIIAYEPLWATETTTAITPNELQDIHLGIRSWLKENISKTVSEHLRIIYGGFVDTKTCGKLASLSDVDGFLVDASLEANFIETIKSV